MDPARAYDLLERLANLVRVEERATAAGAGLQPVHLEILRYLARCNRYSDTPAAVTEWLGATKGTVSQSVGHLVRRRLVSARRDTEDRRLVRLAPTERGDALLAQALRPDALLRTLSNLGADVEATLEGVLTALQRARGGRTFGLCGTCRHLLHDGAGRLRCGLTGEALRASDTRLVCREHEPTSA